jgi:hypothetical protein
LVMPTPSSTLPRHPNGMVIHDMFSASHLTRGSTNLPAHLSSPFNLGNHVSMLGDNVTPGRPSSPPI